MFPIETNGSRNRVGIVLLKLFSELLHPSFHRCELSLNQLESFPCLTKGNENGLKDAIVLAHNNLIKLTNLKKYPRAVDDGG
jgi:hypothetical protein